MLMSNSHLPWSDNDTYFEVQLTAPGVTSYGAVWVGFPVLRQCFTEFVAWTQTTNGPTGADVYRLTLQGDGYVLDGKTQAVRGRAAGHQGAAGRWHAARRAAHDPTLRARAGVLRSPRRHRGAARRRRPIGRGCSSSSGAWAWRRTSTNGATRCACSNCRSSTRCTPIATATSCTSTTPPRRCARTAITRSGTASIPGDRSALIAGDQIVPFDQLPQAIDPPSGWVQNSNDSPWTSTYPVMIDPAKYRAVHRAAAEPHAAVAARHPAVVRVGQDHARRAQGDEAVDAQRDRRPLRRRSRRRGAAARQRRRRRKPPRSSAEVGSPGRDTSDGAFLFLRFIQGAGNNFQNIGGYAVAGGSAAAVDDAARICRSGERAADLLDREARAARRRVRHACT